MYRVVDEGGGGSIPQKPPPLATPLWYVVSQDQRLNYTLLSFEFVGCVVGGTSSLAYG